MSKGKTRSPMGLSARRDKAFELYTRGYTPSDVAREVQVAFATACRYKKMFEQNITDQARRNPTMLKDVLKNTIRVLDEIDQVRQEAWKQYERASTKQQQAQFLNTVLKAQDQRARVYQLLGLKAEVLSEVAAVKEQQKLLLEFMERHLCGTDRERLEQFIVERFQEDLDQLPTADVGH